MRNSSSLRQAWFALPLLALVFTGPATTARAQSVSYAVSNLWNISTAEGRPYLINATATSYSERGVAYSAVNNHAYIVSRANGVLRVAILDGDTGAELGFLNVTGISGGAFALSTISVAADGVIYAANLTTGSATSPYKIYRWADELAAPTVAFTGNPTFPDGESRRFGESFDVRGSGVDTEILASALNTNLVAIFKTTDGASFTSTRLNVAGLSALADLSKGIAFGPTNTFYGKNNSSSGVRLCTYDAGAGTASVLSSFTTVASLLAPIDVDPVKNLLAGVESANATTPHNLRVYDLNSGAAVQIFSTAFPAPAANNGNIVGEVQIAGDRIFAIDTQNGVIMAKIYTITGALPPGITQQPSSQTVVEGGYATLTVGANGTRPLSYEWFHETTAIPGNNTNFLNLTNVTTADAGHYSVTITNEAGTNYSSQATITIAPSVRSSVLSNCWQLPPGSRPWITTDNNQRGVAYNPQTGHLLVVSRSPTNAIYVLDAATGAELFTLNVDPSIITGGTFAINLIAVDQDGQIYAANLTTGAAATPFKLYRWVFEDAELAPTVAYSGDPANGTGGTTSVRWGDNMDLRGIFPTPQVIIGSRAGNQAALLASTDNGFSFTSTPITTDAPNGELGLGIAFGTGDTFWAKAGGTSLRHIAFDLLDSTGTTLQTYGTDVFPGSVTVLGVDAANNYLAGISVETPDNVRLYDIENLANPPVWLDTEFFPSDNANANGTGSMAFGAGKLFTLDTNNGLMALAVKPKLRWTWVNGTLRLSWNAPAVLQSSSTVDGPYTDVMGASSPLDVIPAPGNRFYTLR